MATVAVTDATFDAEVDRVVTADPEPLVLRSLPRSDSRGVVDEHGSLGVFGDLGIPTVPRRLLDAGNCLCRDGRCRNCGAHA